MSKKSEQSSRKMEGKRRLKLQGTKTTAARVYVDIVKETENYGGEHAGVGSMW